MTLTIVCANAYWGRDPVNPITGAKGSTRYRYVLEYRSLFNPHSKPALLTPEWAIESGQYALGFHPARYPVPATRAEQNPR
jgi:hypothetical protein